MIFDEGHVWQFAMNGNAPLVKKKLFKLPKSQGYHGYSDEKGVLYFIQSDVDKPITQFHEKMSKDGHKVIPKSAMCSKVSESFVPLNWWSVVPCPKPPLQYQRGILMDVGFWSFGKKFQDSIGHYFDPIPRDNPRQTHIWNRKKKLWIQGPPLLGFENHEYSYTNYSSLCPIALNRSTTLMIGGMIDKETNNSCAVFANLVFLVDINDFRRNNWKRFPKFPIDRISNDAYNIISKGCLSISKLSQR